MSADSSDGLRRQQKNLTLQRPVSHNQQTTLPALKQHYQVYSDYCETSLCGGGGGSHLLWFFNDLRSVVNIGVSAYKGWQEKKVVNKTLKSE